MQITIYYQDDDEYLMEKVERKADRERRSKSSVVLSIIESYFEAEKRIGEILKDLEAASSDQIEEGLEDQRKGDSEDKLGRILLEKGYVQEVDLGRAITIQNRTGKRTEVKTKSG
ncbi:hypothetical protein K9M78_04620 [Candidatus Bipolaricaulota bacterium]|nr:hypothetical protein [Candidatus Bipolaricaulota bacterium]